MLVYLASPYSHSSGLVRAVRFQLALSALGYLVSSGWRVFSPVVHTHFLRLPHWTNDDWLNLDLPVLEASRGLFVLCIPGWRESRGVNWELEYARGRGMLVKYVVDVGSGWEVRDEPVDYAGRFTSLAGLGWTFFEYQEMAGLTAIYPSVGDRTTYPLMGLAGEVGELLNKVKKYWRDGRGALVDLTEERRREIEGEIGDILWYIARVATEFGVSLSDAAYRNLEKLGDRKSRGVLAGSGDSR